MRTLKAKKRPTFVLLVLLLSFLIPITNSCSKDDPITTEQEESADESSSCTNPVDFIYNETGGLVAVEFEKGDFSEDWTMKTDGSSFSGDGYMLWEGAQQLHNPGIGIVTFKIKITNSGTYRFVWKSAVKMGNNGTDHNDSWLRFADANNFFAKNGNSVVYPNDTGKTPNPEGASKDGWFKIYRNGNDLDFKWQSLTYDNYGHEVFIVFETPGTYLMEVSARSSGHGIDKFVLFNDSISLEEATSSSELSTISCN